MRLFFAIILPALAAASAADASSIVVLKGLETPVSASMVVLGGPRVSQSVAIPAQADKTFEIPLPEPSIARFGGPNALPRNFVAVSSSIIAMIEAPQPIAYENVASVNNDNQRAKRPRDFMPMVIRGGIVGDAFSSSIPAAGNAPAADQPAPQQQVSAPPAGGNGPAAPKPQPGPSEPAGPLPKEALPAAAAPTGRME